MSSSCSCCMPSQSRCLAFWNFFCDCSLVALAQSTWERIYSVTAFYVGFADDLTPAEYSQALDKVGAASAAWAELFGPEGLLKLKNFLR